MVLFSCNFRTKIAGDIVIVHFYLFVFKSITFNIVFTSYHRLKNKSIGTQYLDNVIIIKNNRRWTFVLVTMKNITL